MFKNRKSALIVSVVSISILFVIILIVAFDPFHFASEPEVKSFTVPNYATYTGIVGELGETYGLTDNEYRFYSLANNEANKPLSEFGQIAIAVDRSKLDSLYNNDFSDWGQYCNYGYYEKYHVSDGRLVIAYNPSTDDVSFLEKCAQHATGQVDTYIIEAKQNETNITISFYKSPIKLKLTRE